ncbi:MAG TPA: glycosyltransferase [bacterium]|nr:glycosyltransferase [bacterium]
MRLFLITPHLIAGGAERDTIALAGGLVHRGHRVTLVSHGGALSPEAKDCGVEVVELRTHSRTPRGLARLSRELAALIAERGCDLVHTQAILPAVAARRGLGRGVPVLVTIHNLHRRWSYPLAAGLLRWAADRVLFVSDYERRNFRRCGFPDNLALTVQTGLPDAFFDIEPERTGDRFTFLMPARIDGRKGHDDLLRAVSICGDAPFDVWIAGDGPARRSLERMAARLGVTGRVKFLGFQRDMPALLERVNALVLPSLRESLPLSLREGFAAGLPAVATAVGGIPELVEHGRTGLLVPRRDHRRLARAMRCLAVRPGLVDSMGETARRTAERRWRLKGYLDQLEMVYRELLEGR